MALLLGIAKSTVETIYTNFKPRFSLRKHIPAEIKTLVGYLLLKRVKADLSQAGLALKTGFRVQKIKLWKT